MAETTTVTQPGDLPERYYQYAETQSRVSKWVSETHSYRRGGRKVSKRRGSKSSHYNDEQLSSSQSNVQLRLSSTRKRSREETRSTTPEAHIDPLHPAIALVSSSLVVCAMLPSLLTVLAFAAVLTCISVVSEPDRDADSSSQWVPGSAK